MMAKDVIKNTLDMSHMVLTTYLSDLSDADLMVRSVPDANHIAWQLGHLIASEHQMLSDSGVKMPALPDGFAEAHSKEASKSDDRAKFETKDRYLQRMQQQRDATFAALNKAQDADLVKPTPEPIQAYAKNVSEAFNMIGLHEMMHAAQFVPVRRKLGKPILI